MTTLLKTPAAAKHINARSRTLTGWRARGVGPPYFRIEGMVLYALTDLDEWLQSRRCVPGLSPGPQSDGAAPTSNEARDSRIIAEAQTRLEAKRLALGISTSRGRVR